MTGKAGARPGQVCGGSSWEEEQKSGVTGQRSVLHSRPFAVAGTVEESALVVLRLTFGPKPKPIPSVVRLNSGIVTKHDSFDSGASGLQPGGATRHGRFCGPSSFISN